MAEEPPRSVRHERSKLSATFINNIAVAVIATGLVAPFFTALYGLTNLTAEQIRFFGLAAPGWVIMGAGLHYVARTILGGLEK